MIDNSEQWKEIPWRQGYSISTAGRMKHKGKILKCYLDKSNGYYIFNFYDKGKTTKEYIHRIVAKVFISNPLNKNEIDHINTIRTDNHIENLRWVTRSENRTNPLTVLKRIGIQMSEQGKKSMILKKIDKGLKVVQYSLSDEFIAEYPAIRSAGRQTGIGSDRICRACNGVIKTAGGYKWKYKD